MSTKSLSNGLSDSQDMLKNLHACIQRAMAEVQEITVAIQRGDAVEAAIRRLVQQVQDANQLQEHLPSRSPPTQQLWTDLLAQIDLAQNVARQRMDLMRHQLEQIAREQRLQRAYSLGG